MGIASNRYKRFKSRLIRIMNTPEMILLYHPNEVSGWRVVGSYEEKGEGLLLRANGNVVMLTENNYLRLRKVMKYVDAAKYGKAV